MIQKRGILNSSFFQKKSKKVLLFAIFYDKILLAEFLLIIININGGAERWLSVISAEKA